MSKALRRKTDARCPLERLTTEQRQELFMRGLQADIARGCAYFWRKRDMPEPSLAGEYPGKSVQASPAQPQAQETACQQDTPAGSCQTPQLSDQTPRPIPAVHGK